MFWSARFGLFWIAWLIFADKSRWREMLPTCIFASLLGSLTDVLIHYYPLWNYDNTIWSEWSDDLSVYPVVVYLFLQWMPQNKKMVPMLIYWLYWTSLAISIEFLHVNTGFMSYPTGEWNIFYSYLADWFLFWLFYRFHKL